MGELADTKKRTAPYIAFATFKTFIEHLNQHIVPARIDKSLLGRFSGGVQSQLLSTLRFLDLVDDGSVPTDSLRLLVGAFETESWSSELSECISRSYSEVFAINLAAVSHNQLTETFREAYRCEGDTLRKAISFFVGAASEAGVVLSPFVTAKKPRGRPVATRRKGKARNGDGGANKLDDAGSPVSGERPVPPRTESIAEKLLSKFPEFDPAWPDSIKEKWFEGYERLLNMGDEK